MVDRTVFVVRRGSMSGQSLARQGVLENHPAQAGRAAVHRLERRHKLAEERLSGIAVIAPNNPLEAPSIATVGTTTSHAARTEQGSSWYT